jgi:hypothetical protein
MAKKINMATKELNEYSLSEFIKIWDRYNGKSNDNLSNKTISSKKEVESFLLGR